MLGNKGKSILGGFKESNMPFKTIIKGVLAPEQLESFDIKVFSKKQISSFIDNKIEENVGKSKEIQKSITESVKEEISNLIPVNVAIGNGEQIKTVFVCKSTSCNEISKAFDPLNKDGIINFGDEEDNNSFSEEDVLTFIKDVHPSDEELLVEFGDGIVEFVNQLIENNKIIVDEDGIYRINDTVDENNDDADGDGIKDENDADKDNDGINDNDEFDDEAELAKLNADAGDNNNNDDNNDNNNDDNDDDEGNQNNNDNAPDNTNSDTDVENDNPNNPFSTENQENPDDADAQGANPGQQQEDANGNADNNANPDATADQNANQYTPEQLEQYAKSTATASLLRFYKNSNDDNLKEIVRTELERRNVNPQSGEDAESAKLNQLRNWVNDYFSSYDVEDLRKYITKLIEESPSKRKELKEHYRNYYSLNNGGNNPLKIDEKEFLTWIEDTYLTNFSFGDLKDYAIRLLETNPGEAKKLKDAYDQSQEKII